MTNFEAVLVFRPEDDHFVRGRDFVKAEFQKHGANILKEEDMNVRDLAYAVKKTPKGHYLQFDISVPSQKIAEFQKSFKLRPEILIHMFVNKDR